MTLLYSVSEESYQVSLVSSIKSLAIFDGVLELHDGALAPHIIVERLSFPCDNTMRQM